MLEIKTQHPQSLRILKKQCLSQLRAKVIVIIYGIAFT